MFGSCGRRLVHDGSAVGQLRTGGVTAWTERIRQDTKDMRLLVWVLLQGSTRMSYSTGLILGARGGFKICYVGWGGSLRLSGARRAATGLQNSRLHGKSHLSRVVCRQRAIWVAISIS